MDKMYGSTQQPKKKEICPSCRGTGKVMNNDLMNWGWKTCQACNGTGFIEYVTPQPRLNPMQGNSLKFRRP